MKFIYDLLAVTCFVSVTVNNVGANERCSVYRKESQCSSHGCQWSRTNRVMDDGSCNSPKQSNLRKGKESKPNRPQSLSSQKRLNDFVAPDRRVDCHPEPIVKGEWLEASCLARQCVYDPHQDLPTTPQCYFPKKPTYVIKQQSKDEVVLVKADGIENPFGINISPLSVKVSRLGAILNVRIGNDDRYRPRVNLQLPTISSSDDIDVKFYNDSNGFSFTISRKSRSQTIWDTSIGGLLFSDQYIQIAAAIGVRNLYGFGENVHQTLPHDLSRYTTWPMFARDQPPDSVAPLSTANLYGVHGFYMGMANDMTAHGVLILNSGPQEVTIGPAPHIVYRTIAGLLDVYFFPGPSPNEVISQYLCLIGKPFLPAYWALGFQLCRYGYKNLEELKQTVEDVQKANIPLDIIYADIDYMDRHQDFTLGKDWLGFPEYAKKVHNENLHLFLIFDPAVEVDGMPFERGLKNGAKFVEWRSKADVQNEVQKMYPIVENTTIMLGVVWPDKHVAFPDFSSNATKEWWISEFVLFHQMVEFDGIWIDMNEPANFATNELSWYVDFPNQQNLIPLRCHLSDRYESPKYSTYGVYGWGPDSHLSSKTLCMTGKTVDGFLYDNKNLYGTYEARATVPALHRSTGKRGAIISRSTFPTAGQYGGHWLGDNSATWRDLQTSIVGIQEFNMFGLPYVGADICGFRLNTTEELCLRWQQLGAFYSFSRNHNDDAAIPQHPSLWSSVAAAARQANLFRYHHLPYLYSLHFDAFRKGSTVIRPVFFEFPNDTMAQNLSYQFMWGSAMMVLPVYVEGVKFVTGYLPPLGTWYSLREEDYGLLAKSGHVTFEATLNQMIPVFIRGGHIVPRQAPEMTTVLTLKNPFELLIALDHISTSASGFLYWDDGETIVNDITTYDYSVFRFAFDVFPEFARLTINVTRESNIIIPKLNVIEVFGYRHQPNFTSVTVGGVPLKVDLSKSVYVPEANRLSIEGIQIDMSKGAVIAWNHEV